MDLNLRATVSDFQVVGREGVGLTLNVVLRSTETELRTSLPGFPGTFEWPAAVELSLTMEEGEIAERFWALRGATDLKVAIRIEASDGSL